MCYYILFQFFVFQSYTFLIFFFSCAIFDFSSDIVYYRFLFYKNSSVFAYKQFMASDVLTYNSLNARLNYIFISFFSIFFVIIILFSNLDEGRVFIGARNFYEELTRCLGLRFKLSSLFIRPQSQMKRYVQNEQINPVMIKSEPFSVTNQTFQMKRILTIYKTELLIEPYQCSPISYDFQLALIKLKILHINQNHILYFLLTFFMLFGYFYPYYKMQNLCELTNKIKKWNMMGHSALPSLDIIIITGNTFKDMTIRILKIFECAEPTLFHEKYVTENKEEQKKGKQVNNEIMVQKKEQEHSGMIQEHFVMKQQMYGKIYVIKGLSDTQIKDYQFRQRKKLIQKYKKQKYLLFIVFSPEDKKQLSKNQQHLVQFGLIRNTDCIIQIDKNFNDSNLLHEIIMKYENSFKFQLVNNYRLMKDLRKKYQKQSKRYIQWKKVIKKEINPITYSLMSHRIYTDAMKSSFSGTYSSLNHYEMLGIALSINWTVMQLLHSFWQVQSEKLFKVVDSFPLSHIQQKYKMSDHYSIGGFLPDTCFKAIFSPPLYQFRNALMVTVDNIKHSILRHIQVAINYTFEQTNVLQALLEKQLQNIQAICDKFIEQLSNSLQSQIQFIHANPQDFWNYRQLNSSFYSPDQQVYIQIKYIGKAYVRKVYQSVKDAVPRFIGQGLLKKIVRYLSEQSINKFIDLTRVDQFQIVLSPSQLSKYEADLQILKQLDTLVNFFSMRVSSSFLIKNFHEKKLKEWDRMFGRSQKVEKIKRNEDTQVKGGFLGWMKKLFKINKTKSKERRANSGQKRVQKQKVVEQTKENKMDRKNLIINQKNWLLIINTGRQVSNERIKQSSLEGFPQKFRSSIWMYLSTKGKPKGTKLKNLLNEPARQETIVQIDKDIIRTSPPQLFKYSMKTSLKNVLLGYSIYDKQLSYTQGMNSIAAIIITTLINYGQKTSALIDNRVNYEEVEEKAFCILKFIMEDCGVRKIMKIQMGMLSDLSVRINDRIKELSPVMSQLIAENVFTVQMLFSSPLIACLTNVTKNSSLMRRFIDVLITHDFYIVSRIIAQFVAHCQIFKQKINSDNVYDFFKNKMYDQVYDIIGDEGLSKMFQNL